MQAVVKGMDPKDKQDCVIRKNVQVALATQLHEESVPFRREQKRYLEKLKENESKSKYVPTSSSVPNFEDEGFGDVQLAMLENSEFDAQAREKEIVHVAESIKDLQTIFKELAVLVIDQVCATASLT
jgi:syntaxin 16